MSKFKFSVILCSICTLIFSTLFVSAERFTPYQNMTPTASNTVNLLSRAMSYDSFQHSDYVVFSESASSFYIVWGKLELESTGNLVGTDLEYFHLEVSGYSGNYANTYTYGVFDDFSLITSDFVSTSNVPEYGFVSSSYNDFVLVREVIPICVLFASFLFVIMIVQLRRKDI